MLKQSLRRRLEIIEGHLFKVPFFAACFPLPFIHSASRSTCSRSRGESREGGEVFERETVSSPLTGEVPRQRRVKVGVVGLTLLRKF
jgi:hypothetical protein